MLSPLLFSLFTSDFNVQSSSCIVIKYADDTALTGLISGNDESEYRTGVNQFVDWCERNNLVLNVNKTKEMVFNFQKNIQPVQPVKK